METAYANHFKYLNLPVSPLLVLIQVIAGFYSDTSFVVWNGHPKTGSTEIASFYQSLPISEHRVTCFDAQPMQDGQGQSSVLVACHGMVKFDGQPREELFTQNFILTKQGDVWKVASDCFRFLDQL